MIVARVALYSIVLLSLAGQSSIAAQTPAQIRAKLNHLIAERDALGSDRSNAEINNQVDNLTKQINTIELEQIEIDEANRLKPLSQKHTSSAHSKKADITIYADEGTPTYVPPLPIDFKDRTSESKYGFSGFVVGLMVLVVYFLPTFVAIKRKCESGSGIVIVNVFLGWTFIGWVVSLAWAATGKISAYSERVATSTSIGISHHP